LNGRLNLIPLMPQLGIFLVCSFREYNKH
jgi:hypothetical protein